jgi:hypothetical protein
VREPLGDQRYIDASAGKRYPACNIDVIRACKTAHDKRRSNPAVETKYVECAVGILIGA